jgi:hypothetical protein
MRLRLLTLFTLCALLCALVASAVGQSGPAISAIVRFQSSVTSASLADVEAGTVETTLSWHIVNVAAGQSVALDYFVQNGWQSVLTEGEALAPVGEKAVTLADPLSFGPPTFRLTLISGRNVVDQRYLTIAIDTPAETTPEITAFTTETTNLESAALASANTRVVVSWEVANRIPQTNLVFEQVLGEDETRSVELPRATLYVFSAGSGPVQPIAPASGPVVLRLSVVDVVTGDVYSTAELEIPVDGAADAAPAPEATPEATAAPETAGAPGETPALDQTGVVAEATAQAAPAEAGPIVNVFTVTPTTTAPGTNVTIAWNIDAAATVQIQEVLADGTIGITYISLPALGAISVPVPAGGAPVFAYRLTATDEAGVVVTREVQVTIA